MIQSCARELSEYLGQFRGEIDWPIKGSKIEGLVVFGVLCGHWLNVSIVQVFLFSFLSNYPIDNWSYPMTSVVDYWIQPFLSEKSHDQLCPWKLLWHDKILPAPHRELQAFLRNVLPNYSYEIRIILGGEELSISEAPPTTKHSQASLPTTGCSKT